MLPTGLAHGQPICRTLVHPADVLPSLIAGVETQREHRSEEALRLRRSLGAIRVLIPLSRAHACPACSSGVARRTTMRVQAPR